MALLTRRRAFLLGMALVVGGWFLLPALCRPPQTPEGRVRAAIQGVADGVGDGDIVAALAPVSRSYADAQGGDFATVRAILWRELQSRGPITVTLGPMEVELGDDGTTADAHFVALLMDGLNVGALDIRADNADAWHFDVQLELEDDDEWRITSHERRGVEPQDVFL
jgi:hypothetical protein